MNRIDRLSGILLELQGKCTLQAENLASLFEVSTRTIYRDIQAPLEIGVPITSTKPVIMVGTMSRKCFTKACKCGGGVSE